MAQQPPPANQKREFVRVDDTLPLAWRRISPNRFAEVMAFFEKNRSFPPKINDINQIIHSLDVADKLRQLEMSDPVMASIMGRLDQKLNMLLRLFHPGEGESPMVLTPVNLSGGGLSFLERNPQVAKGDFLELRLAITVDALMAIECFARVMAMTENTEQGMTRVACRFEPIMDQDRERLIQYIFKRQSDLLRAKRGY